MNLTLIACIHYFIWVHQNWARDKEGESRQRNMEIMREIYVTVKGDLPTCTMRIYALKFVGSAKRPTSFQRNLHCNVSCDYLRHSLHELTLNLCSFVYLHIGSYLKRGKRLKNGFFHYCIQDKWNSIIVHWNNEVHAHCNLCKSWDGPYATMN